jgi:hypothetical protein
MTMWQIRNVASYKGQTNPDGIVRNAYTGKPRLMRDKERATAYAELSHFGKCVIEEVA